MKSGSKSTAALWLFVLLMVLGPPCSCLYLSLDIPSIITVTWQTVYVEDVGSFMVPAWWVVEQQDGVIYITDRPRSDDRYNTYAIGVVQNGDIECEYAWPHELLDGVVREEIELPASDGAHYSNSAGYYLDEYTYNGERIERFLVYYYSPHPNKDAELVKIALLIWDKGFFYKYTVSNIAKSFTFVDTRPVTERITREGVVYCLRRKQALLSCLQLS